MIKMKLPREERCETMCDLFFSWLTLQEDRLMIVCFWCGAIFMPTEERSER